eukprot:scpid80010/ scgid29252/ 
MTGSRAPPVQAGLSHHDEPFPWPSQSTVPPAPHTQQSQPAPTTFMQGQGLSQLTLHAPALASTASRGSRSGMPTHTSSRPAQTTKARVGTAGIGHLLPGIHLHHYQRILFPVATRLTQLAAAYPTGNP